MGSATRILDFQNVLSCASSGVIRSSYISRRTQTIHLTLGLRLGLFPGTIISTIYLISLISSILCMCLISLTLSCMLFTPSSFLKSSLFTLSLSVTPLIVLKILISSFSRESVLPFFQLSNILLHTEVLVQ